MLLKKGEKGREACARARVTLFGDLLGFDSVRAPIYSFVSSSLDDGLCSTLQHHRKQSPKFEHSKGCRITIIVAIEPK